MTTHLTDCAAYGAPEANCDCGAQKPNRRQRRKALTRAKLIEVARALWAEPGTYESVTIRLIAKAAGLSTGSIFANFTGKEDLWREAMGFEPPVDSAEVRDALQAAQDSAERAALAQAGWAA